MKPRKLFTLLLALCMVITLLPVSASAATVDSGNCSGTVTWSLNSYGTLTLSGYAGTDDWPYSASPEHLAPWHEHKDRIYAIVVKEGITYIGDYAFTHCNNLVSVSLPNTLTGIGTGAFYGCSKLASITLPDSLTEMDHSVFTKCTSLANVTLPKYLTVLPGSTFEYCTALKTVVIPESVTEIGSKAFRYCSGLTSLDLPDGITRIDNYAFSGCSSLTELELPARLRYMGYEVFAHLCGITDITIPQKVESLSHTFRHAVNLQTITFLGNAPDCASEVFGNITVTVYYPSNNETWTESYRGNYGGTVTWVGYVSDLNWDPVVASGTCGENLTWTLTDENILMISGSGDMADYPSYGAPWYDYADKIEDVVIESGVTSIGDNAFMGCNAIRTAEIADTVTSIGGYSFQNCSALTKLTVPAGVTTIGDSAFSGCTSMERITFCGDAPTFGALVFNGIRTTIYCPKENATWTEDVMQNYGGTVTWVIPEPEIVESGVCSDGLIWTLTDTGLLTVSGSGAMMDYTLNYRYAPWLSVSSKVKHIVVEDGITSIGAYAFYELNFAETVTIPESVTSIGNAAFKRCTALQEAELPSGLTYLGFNAFENCSSLTSIRIPEGVTELNSYAFNCCYALESVELHDDITLIGNHTFYNTALTAIEIPQNVTYIGEYAFQGSAISEITIPANVVTIGKCAFYGCDKLESVLFLGNAPSIGGNCFGYVTATAYYPPGNGTWTTDVMQDYGGTITWVCGDHAHDYVAEVTPATCTTPGYTTYSCTLCVDRYVADEVEALGHDYESLVTPATCTEGGNTTHTCTRCGDFYVTDVTEAFGHSYESAQVEATCTEPGGILHTCTVCGDSYLDKQTDALGHTFEDGFCTVCGQSERAIGDVNGDGEIDILDANLIVAWYNEIRELDEESLAAADVNGDGEVDIMDANMIVAYYNEVIDTFPAKK